MDTTTKNYTKIIRDIVGYPSHCRRETIIHTLLLLPLASSAFAAAAVVVERAAVGGGLRHGFCLELPRDALAALLGMLLLEPLLLRLG